MRRLWAGLALMTVVAVAGCMADNGESGQTSAPEPGTGPTAMAGPTDMVDCLADKGWETEDNLDGSYRAAVPTEQIDKFNAAERECVEELGLDQPWSLNEAQAEAYFDALLEAAECVREMGYEVADPPSRQAAIEEIMVPPIDLGWNPYEAPVLGAAAGDELDELFAACPRPAPL